MYDTIKEYFDAEYGKEYTKKVAELSKSQDGKSLVTGDFSAYSFDDIFKKYKNSQKLHSIDAVVPYDDKIILIEFKSGFEDKINKETFDKKTYEKNKFCDKQNLECENLVNFLNDYYHLFYKKRMSEKQELISSLKLKLYDAIFFIKNSIFPKCTQKRRNIEIVYLIVVDSIYVQSRENTIMGLSKSHIKTPEQNILIESKMNICQKLLDAENEPLCDKLIVVGVEKFLRHCSCGFKDLHR